MMDIVDRLREVFQQRRHGRDGEYEPDFDLFDVAADEIERLRAVAHEAIDLGLKAQDRSIKTFREIKDTLNGSSI